MALYLSPVVYAATSVTIHNEAFGNNATGRAAAATLDDNWVSSLPSGAVRPDLFSGPGTHTGSKTFSNSILAPYQVDWQVGYINTLGPGTPISTNFVDVTTGTVTKGAATSIQAGAPNPYSSEVRLSTGYSAFALNAIKLDFNNSTTNITEFGFFIGDLESRVNNGTAGRVIVYDTTGGLLADAPIQFTGTVLNGTNYDSSDPFGFPTGAANNATGSWGNSTTAFISVTSDQAIGEVIIHVGDDDHTSNNNGSSEQLGLAGFQIADNFIVVPVNPTITLLKTVDNTGGGVATTADFTLSYTDGGINSGSGISASSAVTNVTVPAGIYTISESSLAGYLQSSLVCTGTADTNPSDGLTLIAGESAICTFTNTFVGSSDLSVTKTLDTAGPYTSGQTITYTIVVANSASSASAASNVLITDLPTNLTNLSILSATTCPTGAITSTVICTISSLAIGASETITVQATAP